MATTLSVDEFLQNLKESGILTAEEISSTLARLPEAEMADETAISKHLIAAGLLTPFQAEAVRERRLGELVIGSYDVLDRIGAGGMGAVYKARHRRMRRVVAIKILSSNLRQDAELNKRFQREVEAIARLSHPNIVIAHDAGEADDRNFLVMEFVNGRDLASEVKQRGPLAIPEALDCIVQAARALEYAHRQGIIHRDIKPANLLKDASGVVKVADLGLARFDEALNSSSREASALTQTGTVMGTPDFMSPKQAGGLPNIDHRADIYSLGCTLHFLLLGSPPYQGSNVMATLLMHCRAPIPSLRQARSIVPAELDAVFRRMVAKEPSDRYPTMTEALRELESVEAKLKASLSTVETDFVLQSPGGDSAGEAQETTFSHAPEVAAPTLAPGAPGLPPISAPKVLLVEPSRTQSGIIRKYLQPKGIEHILSATSGGDALHAYRKERPDVVVCALHLPDMTGVHLAEQIQAEFREAAAPFVLISSESESAEVGSLSKCGRASLLKKPFTPEQLIQSLTMVHAVRTAPGRSKDVGGLRVLIVDDSAAARVHIRNVLQGLGLTQFTDAPDGARAVAALAAGNFDLIVTDYNMPFMDGRALVDYVRQNPATASVPIIMVTTEQDAEKLAAVRQLGVAAVCDKTFPAEAVRKVLDDLVATP